MMIALTSALTKLDRAGTAYWLLVTFLGGPSRFECCVLEHSSTHLVLKGVSEDDDNPIFINLAAVAHIEIEVI
jgi:hypothetical protein